LVPDVIASADIPQRPTGQCQNALLMLAVTPCVITRPEGAIAKFW
jgi:hypothetical protein